jgi:hypothetical protein
MALKASSTSKSTTRTRKTKATAEPLPPPEPEAIAVRAYEIYESGEGGDPIGHWLQAERELEAAAGVA